MTKIETLQYPDAQAYFWKFQCSGKKRKRSLPSFERNRREQNVILAASYAFTRKEGKKNFNFKQSSLLVEKKFVASCDFSYTIHFHGYWFRV